MFCRIYWFCLKVAKIIFLGKVTDFLPRMQMFSSVSGLMPESIDMSVQMNMV